MKRLKTFILLIIAAVLLTGCIQKTDAAKTDSVDTTAETGAARALETDEQVESTQNNTKTYTLKSDQETFLPQIILNEKDKTFSFTFDLLSSYLSAGTYTEKNGQLELKTDDGKYHYTFDIVDENTLKFNEENSSEVRLTDDSMGVKIEDGAEFILIK